jgi:prepilin-type N-terminal cleavage/methylation domain-containing protein
VAAPDGSSITNRRTNRIDWRFLRGSSRIRKIFYCGGNHSVTHHPTIDEPPGFRRGAGFTLVEVLIVIAIIGILAVIAIPQFISYRSRSVDAQMKSDLRNAAVAVESYYTKKNVYPSSMDEIEGFGFQPTEGVTLTLDIVSPNSYTITAAKPGGTQATFTFSSANGSIN